MNTFKPRLARKLTAVGVLAALMFGLAGPVQAATPDIVAVMLTQVTGTAPFDADDAAGNDSSGGNTVVRTNDTVQYNTQVTTGSAGAPATHILLDLPKGEQAPAALPPYCLSGSSVSPAMADPKGGTTASTWASLPAQTIDCVLGDLPPGSAQAYPLYAKVRPEVPNGTTLSPVDATVVSGSTQMTTGKVTHSVSAKASFDMALGYSTNPNGAAVWGPNQVACPTDPVGCYQTHSIAVMGSVPTGGRGASPLLSGFSFTIDLSAKGIYGSQITSDPEWIAAGAGAEAKYRPVIPATYGDGCLRNSSTGAGPYSVIGYNGAAKADENRSVRNSGTISCSMNSTTGVLTVTVTGADTSGWTYPTTTNLGKPLPSDRAYVFSKEFGIDIPIQTIKDLGTQTTSPSGASVWTLAQTVAVSELKAKSLSGATLANTPFTKVDNNYKTSSIVAKNEGAADSFWVGVPNTRGNTDPNLFSPSYGVWEGLPGQTDRYSGDGVLLKDQVGLINHNVDLRTMDSGYGDLSCAVWDNKLLALAADDYPANSLLLQNAASGGAAVWVSGAYDSTGASIDIPGLEIQYGYSPTFGNNAASTCNNADSTIGWFTSPTNAAFGNDPVRAADGTYTGVNKVRVLMKTPVLNRSVMNLAIAVRNISTKTTGATLPFYASWKPIRQYANIAAGVADAGTVWNTSTYSTGGTGSTAQAGGGGGRVLVGSATSSIKTEVQDLSSAWTSGTPAYVAGTVVQARLSPALSTPVDTDKSYPTTVEACLPDGASYVAGSASVAPGTASVVYSGTSGTSVSCGLDMTYMSWNLGRRVPNTVIPPVTFAYRIDATTVNGTLSIPAAVTVTGDPSPAVNRTDTANFQVMSPVGIKIARIATKPVIEVNAASSLVTPRTMTWTTKFSNMNAPAGVSNVEVVEVLPRNGYGSTHFTGTFTLNSVAVVSGTGVTLEYAVNPTLSINATGTPSAVTWTATAPTTPAGWDAVTGVRIKRAGPFVPGDDLSVRFVATPMNNNGGDVYTGQVAGKAAGLAGNVGPLETSVQVVASTIGNRAWIDQDKDGIQDAGEKGLAGQKVTLTGTDSLGNTIAPATDTTDANGYYGFGRLASGTYSVDFDKASLDSRFLSVTKALANAGTNDSCAASTAKCTVTLLRGEDRADIDLGVTAVTALTLSTTASPASGVFIAPKDTVTFTMTVKNTGQQPFTSTTAVDTISPEYTLVAGSIVPSVGSASATVSPTSSKITWTGPLAAGATATVTFKATVDQDTAEDTDLTSALTGSGTWFGGVQTSTCDPANAPASCRTLHTVAWPHLVMTTTVARPVSDGTNLAKLGENLSYTTVMKNVGKVPVINKTGNVQVPVQNDLATDGASTALDFGLAATPLAPSASTAAAAKVFYQVTQDDMDWGNIMATTDGSATTAAGYRADADQIVTDQPLDQTRSLAMHADITDDSNDGIAQVGEELIYRFKVVNTGTVSVDAPSITDTYLKGRKVGITPEHTFDGRISPAEAVTFISRPVVVGAADKATGSITVAPYASGADRLKVAVKSNTDEVIIDTPSASGLDLVKRATDAGKDGFADLNEKLTYTFTVTNNSDVDFHAVGITDPMLAAAGVAINAPAGFNGVLAPRQSATFTSGPYTVDAADLTAGTVKNTATATAQDSLNAAVASNDSSVSLPTATTPVIVKTGSGAGPADSLSWETPGPAMLRGAAGGLLGAAALCMLFLAYRRRRKAL